MINKLGKMNLTDKQDTLHYLKLIDPGGYTEVGHNFHIEGMGAAQRLEHNEEVKSNYINYMNEVIQNVREQIDNNDYETVKQFENFFGIQMATGEFTDDDTGAMVPDTDDKKWYNANKHPEEPEWELP
jgi:hypothetical protein